jgi:hypothetical protein
VLSSRLGEKAEFDAIYYIFMKASHISVVVTRLLIAAAGFLIENHSRLSADFDASTNTPFSDPGGNFNTRHSSSRDRDKSSPSIHPRKTEKDFLRQIELVEAGEGVDYIVQVIDHFGYDSEESRNLIRAFFHINGARLPPHEIVDAYEAIGDEELQKYMPAAVSEAFGKDGVDLAQAIKIGSLMPYKRVGHCGWFMQNFFLHRMSEDKSIDLIVKYLPELREGEQRDGAILGFASAIKNGLLQKVDDPDQVIQAIQTMGLTESELESIMKAIQYNLQRDDQLQNQ